LPRAIAKEILFEEAGSCEIKGQFFRRFGLALADGLLLQNGLKISRIRKYWFLP
jgi:hypothetical protein